MTAQTLSPADYKSTITTYWQNTQPVTQLNDLALADNMRELLIGHIASAPKAYLAETLDAVKERNGEVRRLLTASLEMGLVSSLTADESALLGLVIVAQGQSWQGDVTNQIAQPLDFDTGVRTMKAFKETVLRGQSALPKLGYRAALIDNDFGVKLELGVTYGGYCLPQAGNIIPLRAPGKRA